MNHTPTPQRLGPLSYEAALAAQLRAKARIAELEAALRKIARHGEQASADIAIAALAKGSKP